MANTVDLDKITEYHDDPAALREKLRDVAAMIRESKHMIVFTGAGISTAANIPDFRGPNGVWTCQAKGVAAPRGVSLVRAQPTKCHTFLKNLCDSGVCKYVVSQNIDGLHRRSGIPADSLSELHGNCFLEVCWGCDATFPHVTEINGRGCKNTHCPDCKPPRVPHFCHCTENNCPHCGKVLKDSVIHFGESLPPVALERAYQHAKEADLCLVLGSSLTVSPANDIPRKVAQKGKKNGGKGKLVIVNLQVTPLDSLAATRIFGQADEVADILSVMLKEGASSSLPSATSAAAAAAGGDAGDSVTSAATPSAPPTVRHPRNSTEGPVSVCIGNRHRSIVQNNDPSSNEWTMETTVVHGGDRLVRVTYYLHPTFEPSEVVVECTEGNPRCELTRVGWGTFPVRALLEFQSGRRCRVKHALNFDDEWSSSTFEV